MENSTIYHRVKRMVLWSRFIRICPVNIIPVTPSLKYLQKVQPIQHQNWNKKEEKPPNQPHFYYELSNIQCFFNLGYIISVAILGVICEAILYNLTQNSTQKIGSVSYVLTLFILPLAIISVSNRNAPKVNELI